MREKRDIYAEMGVIEYWRFDPTSNYFFPPLVGEVLGESEYRTVEMTTNNDGLVWGHSAVLGLNVCAFPDGNLRFYDPVSGQWLRTHGESEAALRAETAARQAARDKRQKRSCGCCENNWNATRQGSLSRPAERSALPHPIPLLGDPRQHKRELAAALGV